MEEKETGTKGILQNKKFLAIAVVILLIVCSIGGYLYYKRTPAYSMQLIHEAVKEHNWEKFSRHVDTKSLSDAAFDDIIEITMDEKGTDASTRVMASSIAQLVKPMVSGALESAVKEYVETGELKQDKVKEDSKPAAGKKRASKNVNPADKILSKTDTENMKFNGVKATEVNGSVATVTMEVHDEKHDVNYDIKFRMVQLEDGTWKLTKIENLKDIYNILKEADEKKQAN